jgi:pyruvate dehydrogenase phosphatase
MTTALQRAFLRLDADLSRAALSTCDAEALRGVASGCVATLAHVDGDHVHVASCGDVRGGFQDQGMVEEARTILSHS